MSAVDAVVFGAFVIVIVALVAVLWKAGTQRAKPGQVEMVFIAFANGEPEASITTDALRVAGIRATIRNVRNYETVETQLPLSYEIWVPASDERRARDVLRL